MKPNSVLWICAAMVWLAVVVAIAQTQGPVTVRVENDGTATLLNPTQPQARSAIGLSALTATGTAATFGSLSLVAGTGTVTTTAVLTGSHVHLTHGLPGASTAIGILALGTINNGVFFTVKALKPADATVETGDASEVKWTILAQ